MRFPPNYHKPQRALPHSGASSQCPLCSVPRNLLPSTAFSPPSTLATSSLKTHGPPSQNPSPYPPLAAGKPCQRLPKTSCPLRLILADPRAKITSSLRPPPRPTVPGLVFQGNRSNGGRSRTTRTVLVHRGPRHGRSSTHRRLPLPLAGPHTHSRSHSKAPTASPVRGHRAR